MKRDIINGLWIKIIIFALITTLSWELCFKKKEREKGEQNRCYDDNWMNIFIFLFQKAGLFESPSFFIN